MRKIKSLLFIFASLAITVIPACKKNRNDNSTKPLLSLTKSEYLPGEIAIIQASGEIFDKNVVMADISGVQTPVTVDDSNRLFFIVPVLPTGSYLLNLNRAEFDNPFLTLNVGNYTAITDVEGELTKINADAEKRIGELTAFKDLGLNINEQHLAEIQALNVEFKSAVGTLSTYEKEQLTYFMLNNHVFTEALPAISFVDSFYRRNNMADPSDELWKQSKTFALQMIQNAAMVGMFVHLMAIPDAVVTKVIALGIAYKLAINIEQTTATIDKIGDLIGLAGGFEFSGLKQFVSNKTTSIIDRVRFRNLTSTDKGLSDNIDEVIEKAELYQSYRDKLHNAWSKIKSWFSNVPDKLSGTAAKLKSTIKTQIFKVKHSYLSVGQSSNNKIEVKVVEENGESKLQVNSDLTEKTNFQFNITYNHPDLGNSITKTIDAEFDPGYSKFGTFTDPRDGQVYKTVQIGNQTWGNQTWFAENLRYSGSIAQMSDSTAWSDNFVQAAWCYYNNNPANDVTYGKLYNLTAVNTSYVCPAGWHVPSDAEWTTLTDYLGGTSIAGGKMKSTTGWNSPNMGASDSSGFSGLPGGLRYPGAQFAGIGGFGYWWSTTRSYQDNFHIRILNYDNGAVYREAYYYKLGLSVRCIKD